jgi:protein transport protein SEC31
MSVKYVEKYAVPAWCPVAEGKSLLALGGSGITGGLDGNNVAGLDIYSVDGNAAGDSLSAVCHHRVDSAFRSIAWANLGSSSPLGIIAGGHLNGTVSLWDASRLIPRSNASSSPSRGASPLLFSQDIHGSKAVLCMEFNPQKQSLLGSGGADGTVQVLNIERPSNPDIFRGVTTTRHANSDVICVSWNRKVQHILASASDQGLTVVWDLKNKKEVVTIKDPANRTRCSSLSWNPEIPTQLLIAYNDDHSPCVQLWDMRNCSYPFREFQEHSRGITHASFCDMDGSFVVSSGRDNRSVCWSLHSGSLEAYSDLNLNTPATKMEWSPHLPGFIAASSATGTVSVHSISQRQTSVAARHPPKWVKLPCGAAFGFGGKLVTFGSKQGSTVGLHIVPDEPSVVGEADRFEDFLARDLRPFCDIKSQETNDDHERLTWRFISILHSGPAGRRNLAAALGVDQSQIQSMAEHFLGRQNSTNASLTTASKPLENMEAFGDGANLDPDQLDNLFDQIARTSEQQQNVVSAPNSRRGSPRGGSLDADDHLPMTDWAHGPEAIIKQSILVGDINSAVECCMKCGRYADALFLASGGDPDLWKKTRSEYARKQKDPFIRLVGHVLAHDLEKLVAQSDLTGWVETLSMLVTYASPEEYPKLTEQLAARLEKERFDVRSAVLCYLACGSFSNTVRLWNSMSSIQGSQAQSLQGLVEKMSCLFAAVRPASVDAIFTHKMQQYAELLANSGRIVAAMRCLILIPDSIETRILKERIYNAAPSMMGQLLRQAPAFPFEVADVKAAYVAHHQQQQPAPNRVGGPASFQSHGVGQSATQPHFPAPPTVAHIPPSMGPPPAMRPPQQPVPPSRAMTPTPAPPMTHAPGNAYNQVPAPPQPGYGSVPVGPGPTYNPVAAPPQGVPPNQYNPNPAPSNPQPVNPYNPTPVAKAANPIPPRTSSIPSRPQMPAMSPVSQVTSTTGPTLSPSQRLNQAVSGPMGISSAAPSPTMGRPMAPHAASWNMAGSQAPQSPAVGPPVGAPPASLQRPVTGPPTSSGVSTAPHATANPVTPGMPTSWPIPTPVQQQLSPGVVPPPKSTAPMQTVAGEPVPPQEVSAIQRSLTNLLERCAQDGNRRKWDDTAAKLNELYRMLSQGLISRDSVMKVKELCHSIDRGDFATASRLRVELSTSDWEKNRTWLFAIQLLLPK